MPSHSLYLCTTACGILAILAGWNALRFRKNKSNHYDLRELARYGGKHGTLKNFLRGLASTFNGRHRALFTPSLWVLIGLITAALGLFLLASES